MFAILGLVNLMLLGQLVDVLSQTIGYQVIEVAGRGDRDSFLNPKKNCDENACWKYRATIVGGNCESDNCCTCRCQGENTTYVEHKQQCMSFANIREMVKPQTDDEPQYYLGKPRESCTETCSNFGGTCLSSGHGFTNSSTTLSIFHSLNVSCQTDSSTDQYYYGDSPSYFTGFDQGRCVGFKDVPKTISCTRGYNVDVQRLCPCQEYKNCRYWLVEYQGNPVGSSRNKIPVIDLRATGSVRLSICNHSRIAEKSQLLKCTVEEFTHLQGSQWTTVTNKGKSAIEVVVEQPSANNGVLKVEWKNSLDNKYNGIVGFIKIGCKYDGGRLPICFVFKSISTTETTQKQSTFTTPVATSTKPNGEGNFDLKNRNNETSTTVAVAVTASLVLLIVICALVVLIIWRRRRRSSRLKSKRPTFLPQEEQCVNSSHILSDLSKIKDSGCVDVVIVDNQTSTSRRSATPDAVADPNLAQETAATCHRRCSKNEKRCGDKKPGVSEYMKLHRKENDLYQSLTVQQPGRSSGYGERSSDYEIMEGPANLYQVSDLKETGQKDQKSYPDYEPMRDYVDVFS